MPTPADIEIRLRALTDHDSTILVEAGAGSGKTSIMAGRVALMIAAGEKPGGIAAISYTEASAAELRGRIELFLRDIAAGICPRDLSAVFPKGVPAEVVERAQEGLREIGDLTATTIHGFCQVMLRPYPLEAGMDPGASIVDPAVADLAFNEELRAWLREILNGTGEEFTATLFEFDARGAEKTVNTLAKVMRGARGILAPKAEFESFRLAALSKACADLDATFPAVSAIPDTLAVRMVGVRGLVETLKSAPVDPVAWGLVLAIPAEIELKSGGFPAKGCNKKDWIDLAGKVDGAMRNDRMTSLWQAMVDAWGEMKANCAAVAGWRLSSEIKVAVDRYHAWKMSAAFVDFDDLLTKARDLLSKDDVIRRALGKRFRRVLVDEFQDTDSVQAEILWRLCGDPTDDAAMWQTYAIRPGSLFVVGDPKQAIYRFRGADVGAYMSAKDRMTAGGGNIAAIRVNFRSTEQVISYVNRIYQPVLDASGQPGFTSLEHYRTDRGALVHAIDIGVPDDLEGEPRSEDLRHIEAQDVANLIQHLIGSYEVPGKDGAMRKVTAGDICLLTPTGTDFWVYEAALERAGLPIAAQAGKSFLNRQEVLDLTALARCLSDARDTLALGSFLRGPMIGFTDEAILDAMDAQKTEGRKRLTITMRVDDLPHGRFRDVMEKLQALRRMGRRTTPFQVLQAAVEIFRIRGILSLRHPRSVERSLANLDAFLALSRAWDARGLKSFADEMRRRREDGVRQTEGRPDSGGDAVSIVTIHSSKGLEYPVVVAINTMTKVVERSGPLVTPTGILMRILGEEMAGYGDALTTDKAEFARERQRLLYVADTRARDLLIVPRFQVLPKGNVWAKICASRFHELPSFDLTGLAPDMPADVAKPSCRLSASDFEAENAAIQKAHRTISRRTPSLHEGEATMPLKVAVVGPGEEVEEAPVIAGGTRRGIILHKLMEELLTGEVTLEAVESRATVLISQLGAMDGLKAPELAATVRRALDIAEVKAVWPTLLPELDVARFDAKMGEVVNGIMDASVMAGDKVDLVVDWKSDVAPTDATIRKYQSQLADYLEAASATRGMLVFMTTGKVVAVSP